MMENGELPAKSSECAGGENPAENDVQPCPVVDLTHEQEVDAPGPATEDVSEGKESAFTENEQILQELVTDSAACRNRTESVSSGAESDESSSTDTSDSSDDSMDVEIRRRNVELRDEVDALKNVVPPKVDGELLLFELPPVEDLCIVLPDHAKMHAFGRISQIMKDYSVVVRSYEGMPALDHDTVLFFGHRKAIGKVEETFGPVTTPYYIVRFNSQEHLLAKEVELDKEVFFAPDFHDLTSYVFLSTLRKMRGSDASWLNDKEPPPNFLDYSDDEEERKVKKAMKNKGKEKAKRDHNSDAVSKPTVPAEPDNRRNSRRQNQWHNESRRINVLPLPDPAFEGWNAAVNRMGFHGMRPAYPYSAPIFGQPTSMNGLPIPPMQPPFHSPPPPYMNQSYSGGHDMGNHPGPRQVWHHQPPRFGNGMFMQPPPPPPPPP